MFNNIFLIFALFIVLFLSSCSNKSEIIEGERISVFENKNEVFINEDAYNEGTNLGKIIQNNIFTHPGLNAQHSGGNLEGPMDDEIQNIWKVDVGSGTDKFSPFLPNIVAFENQIYTMDTEGVVSIIDITDGNILWQKKIGDRSNAYLSISGGLSIYNDIIFAFSGDTIAIAFNRLNGEILWQKSFKYPITGGPTANGKGVIFTLLDGSLHMLEMLSGKTLWETISIPEEGGIVGSANPSMDEKIIVAPGTKDNFSVLNIDDGSFLWGDSLASFNFETVIDEVQELSAHPIIYKDYLIIYSRSGKLISYNKFDSSILWEHNFGGGQTPWVAGDSLFIITDLGVLKSIRLYDGAIRWIENLRNKPNSKINFFGPIIASNKLYLTGSDSNLYIFNPETGKLINKIKLSGNISSSPIIVNSKIFILSNDAKLLAYN